MKSIQDKIINYITNDKKSLREIVNNTNGIVFSRLLTVLNLELWSSQELIIDAIYENLGMHIHLH